nr:hypothetical protein [Tanacetum cinerariifolium]
MHTASSQNTTKGSKPKPRSNNQTSRSLPVSKSSCVMITDVSKADHSKNSSSFSDSKQFVCSTCHKCVFSANHYACITKLLKEVNSRAMIQSHKTRNGNKPVDQKSHTHKPGRQIFTGYRFFPNKTSAVYKKTSPRSDLRWKPTGRIFKSVGLKWIPTGKLFDSCTSKIDSEPPHGLNVDIPNIHECKQTLDKKHDKMAKSSSNNRPSRSVVFGGGKVFGGGEVFGGGVVFSGDGVGNRVGSVVCGVACGVVCGERKDSFIKCDIMGNDDFVGVQVNASISTMIVRVPEKDKWCGTRGKFVRWKGVRVTKASKRAKVGVRGGISEERVMRAKEGEDYGKIDIRL